MGDDPRRVSPDPQGVIQRTKPAKPSEYAALLKELHQVGYRNLDIKQRYQYSYLEDRRKAIDEMYNPSKRPKYRMVKKAKSGSRRSTSSGLTAG